MGGCCGQEQGEPGASDTGSYGVLPRQASGDHSVGCESSAFRNKGPPRTTHMENRVDRSHLAPSQEWQKGGGERTAQNGMAEELSQVLALIST